ncbi:MAG: prepilin-type N-terminal cleavage/methylation domain-containing protein [Myxococcota bacterium]
MADPRRRAAGFTLLEVIVAVFVLATVLGALITIMSQNLHRLGEARDALHASQLERARAFALLRGSADEAFPLPGVQHGRFEAPDDEWRWERKVEATSLPLPADWTGPPPSSLFRAPSAATGRAPLLRVSIRAYREDAGDDLDPVPPFVLLLVNPAPAPLSGGPAGGGP